MSCLIPPACVFCRHYHAARNQRSEALPSCNAFLAIPDEIFLGRFDHTQPFPGDGGVRFSLVESDRLDFLELNAVRRELGLLTYREPLRDRPDQERCEQTQCCCSQVRRSSSEVRLRMSGHPGPLAQKAQPPRPA